MTAFDYLYVDYNNSKYHQYKLRMGACIPCCKCSAFFGIIFYIIMGAIVLTQSQFLKFEMASNKDSGIACFIVAGIELIILIALITYEKWESRGSISRQNYVNLQSERNQRPRETVFKGIAMGDLKIIRQEREKQEESMLV